MSLSRHTKVLIEASKDPGLARTRVQAEDGLLALWETGGSLRGATKDPTIR